jgi:glycosyltransferase involved in cell wall biosynthesis
MRVLAVVVAHPLRKIAGATNAARELSLAVSRLVNLELAIMWDRDESIVLDGMRVRHIKATNPLQQLGRWLPRSALVPLYDSRIPAMIRDGDYDLVHIHNLLPAFAAERIATACRRRGVPYVISSHGFNEQSRYADLNGFTGIKRALIHWAIEKPFRRVIRRADAIFALSDCEGGLLAELGVPAERVRVVTNGVNQFYMGSPSSDELAAAKQRFGLGEKPILLFMGSLHGYKGVDVFLRSLAGVTTPFQAVVAGGFKHDQERTALLERSGLGDTLMRSVVFTNTVSNEDLRALYNLATLFVYPTKGDTLPLVVLEAMACGLPIVSTVVGGLPFMVSPAEGVLVAPDDPDAVARAVDSLLGDPVRRRNMAAAVRAKVRNRFQWAAAAERAVEGYQSVLRNRLERQEVNRRAVAVPPVG